MSSQTYALGTKINILCIFFELISAGNTTFIYNRCLKSSVFLNAPSLSNFPTFHLFKLLEPNYQKLVQGQNEYSASSLYVTCKGSCCNWRAHVRAGVSSLSVFAIRFAVQGAFVTVASREDENIDERIEFHKESCQTDAASVTRALMIVQRRSISNFRCRKLPQL
jgi:hypothetical protein